MMRKENNSKTNGKNVVVNNQAALPTFKKTHQAIKHFRKN